MLQGVWIFFAFVVFNPTAQKEFKKLFRIKKEEVGGSTTQEDHGELLEHTDHTNDHGERT